MRIIIAGTREFDDYPALAWRVTYVMRQLKSEFPELKKEDIEIISGGAVGVDTLAERYANNHNLKFTEILADWKKHGKQAGMLRNIEMGHYAREEPNPALIAIWDGQSPGTKQMLSVAKACHIRIFLWNYAEEDNQT